MEILVAEIGVLAMKRGWRVRDKDGKMVKNGTGNMDGDQQADVSDVRGAGKKRKQADENDEVDKEVVFVQALKKADAERMETEKEKMTFERLRFEEECKDRERERLERKEEREAAAELELQKMCLMLEMVVRRDGDDNSGSKTSEHGARLGRPRLA